MGKSVRKWNGNMIFLKDMHNNRTFHYQYICMTEPHTRPVKQVLAYKIKLVLTPTCKQEFDETKVLFRHSQCRCPAHSQALVLAVRVAAPVCWLIVNTPQWDLLPWPISHPDKPGLCATLSPSLAVTHLFPSSPPPSPGRTDSDIFLTHGGKNDTGPLNQNKHLSITDERGHLPFLFFSFFTTHIE